MFAIARPQLKREVCVSCWHARNAESEAMWRYCPNDEDVALRTSYETLDRAVDAAIIVDEVRLHTLEDRYPPWRP